MKITLAEPPALYRKIFELRFCAHQEATERDGPFGWVQGVLHHLHQTQHGPKPEATVAQVLELSVAHGLEQVHEHALVAAQLVDHQGANVQHRLMMIQSRGEKR